MKVCGKISYTVDERHPDINYMKDWTRDKVYSFEDTYTFDDRYYTDMDNIASYIKSDLRLVAGGGYNSEHIHNVKFDLRRI